MIHRYKTTLTIALLHILLFSSMTALHATIINNANQIMQSKAEGFAKGTLVETAQGIKCIECITLDDAIIRHMPDGKPYECRVLATGNNNTLGCVKISLGDNTIVAGPDQLFYLPQTNSWIPAKDLNISHILSRGHGEHFFINHLETINMPTTIYHITVQDHIYGITLDNIIVHNMNFLVAAPLVMPATAPFVTIAMPLMATAYVGWQCLKAAGLIAQPIAKLARNSSGEIPTTQAPDNIPTPTPEMTPKDPEKNKSKKTIKEKYFKHHPIITSGPICEFTKESIEAGVKHIVDKPEKIEHIFKKMVHNLEPLIEECGGYANTTREILIALSGKVHFNEQFEDLVLHVRGFEVYVRGRVMDGIPKLGTFFIKAKGNI